jgi:hypothetical protein
MDRVRAFSIGIAAGFGLLVSLIGGPASAVPITFGFTGTITGLVEEFSGVSGLPSPPTTVLDGSIAPGVGFTGQYTFDSDAVGTPRTSTTVSYNFAGLGFFEVGNYHFTMSPSLRITITDQTPGAGSDGYILAGGIDEIVGPVLSGFSLDGNDFRAPWLEDLDGSALSGTDLPLTPPPLSEFEMRALSVLGYIENPETGEEGDLEISGTFDTLFLVPEPGTALLIGMGLAGLALRRD